MPKDSSDRYYQNNKERLRYKNLPENETQKQNILQWEKIPYYNLRNYYFKKYWLRKFFWWWIWGYFEKSILDL